MQINTEALGECTPLISSHHYEILYVSCQLFLSLCVTPSVLPFSLPASTDVRLIY